MVLEVILTSQRGSSALQTILSTYTRPMLLEKLISAHLMHVVSVQHFNPGAPLLDTCKCHAKQGLGITKHPLNSFNICSIEPKAKSPDEQLIIIEGDNLYIRGKYIYT
ncbi:hypothetical protein BYT27DRAFT_7209853 [Phlegmacium glaucopus]|nr:hypothetical protein BYT27DRAFT_7209853 [Phlegmacium glaucopus]